MRILIITFTFPPNKDGVSEAAAAMTKGFLNRGWNVDILTQETKPRRESPVWQGARIQEFAYLDQSPSPPIRLHDTDATYEEFLTGGSWDVVLIHSYEYPLRRAVPVLGQMPGRKILVSHGFAALIWERVPEFPYGLGLWLRSSLKSRRMPGWIRKFDRAVYLSEQADFRGFYDHLIARMIGYKGRRVIPNGVDPEEQGKHPSDFRREHGIAESAFLLVCVANYSPRKDQGFGARAFRRAAIPGSVLVFVGSEFNRYSEKFQTEDKAGNPNPVHGKIIWLEKQSRDSTLDALAACDAFLLSANHEAQPIAILEAMREGKPWIARDAGCIATMEGGLCVKSEKSMAEAMVKLAADHPLRSRLGSEGAAAVAKRYNRTAYVDAYCKLIEELVPSGH